MQGTAGSASPAGAHVDYSLARRALLRDYHAGRVSRFEICDAHPDLIRAAVSSGEETQVPCPVCDAGPVLWISYVFSDELSKRENGKVWQRADLAPLLKFREVRLYTIEVCPECSWNHLRSQAVFGHGRAARRAPRRGRATT